MASTSHLVGGSASRRSAPRRPGQTARSATAAPERGSGAADCSPLLSGMPASSFSVSGLPVTVASPCHSNSSGAVTGPTVVAGTDIEVPRRRSCLRCFAALLSPPLGHSPVLPRSASINGSHNRFALRQPLSTRWPISNAPPRSARSAFKAPIAVRGYMGAPGRRFTRVAGGQACHGIAGRPANTGLPPAHRR